MKIRKINSVQIISFIFLIFGCESSKIRIDRTFLGVEDNISLEYASENLERVLDSDVEMYIVQLDSNIVFAYTFFSEELSVKKWHYFIKSTENLKQYFPGFIYCRTTNCEKRLLEGDNVILENRKNNQIYTCNLDVENEPYLRFYYLFKRKTNIY